MSESKHIDTASHKTIKQFIDNNYRHFNAQVIKAASQAYVEQLRKGNKMFLAMAGAMSTAEIGISLAEMIRNNKIHAICCTGANLEEDIFNLVAHDHYELVPHYRDLSPQDEQDLLDRKLNRVTDTCIPEEEAMRRIERHALDLWQKAEKEGKRYFPYEYMYQLIRNRSLDQYHQIDPKHAWVVAASEKDIPIFVPGWEDSTLGNVFVAMKKVGKIKSYNMVKNGFEVLDFLADWYLANTKDQGVGFFQIGGGIAGDFPICVVPMIEQDMRQKAKLWSYFCQISDSTTSYGSYSGAVPNEKITWGKLGPDTPRFVIESDASIVAPLMFSYVLAG